MTKMVEAVKMVKSMTNDNSIAGQPQNAGKDETQQKNVGDDSESTADVTKSIPGEIARIVCSTEREAFEGLFSGAGGKPKWKSREKFIMAGCTLLKKITTGDLVMLQGRGKDPTKIDVIEVSVPKRRVKGDAKADVDEEAEPKIEDAPAQDVLSAIDPSIADQPVARYFALVSRVLKAEEIRDKAVKEAEKNITMAQKSLDNFLKSNWDVLKASRLITPAVDMELRERARIEDQKRDDARAAKRKEMADLEREAAKDK